MKYFYLGIKQLEGWKIIRIERFEDKNISKTEKNKQAARQEK